MSFEDAPQTRRWKRAVGFAQCARGPRTGEDGWSADLEKVSTVRRLP